MISMTVVGNVGGEVKRSATDGGTAVLRFSIACNEGKGDRKTTTWVRVSVFGKQVDGLAPLIASGNRVAATGSAKLREWTGQDNQKRVDLELDARDVDIIDYPEKSAQPAPAQAPAAAAPPGPPMPPGVPAGSHLHPPGAPTMFCRPGSQTWEPIPAAAVAPPAPPPAPAYAPPPPPAAAPQARVPF